ncbi:unnamed protein product, partial [Linum tenue]
QLESSYLLSHAKLAHWQKLRDNRAISSPLKSINPTRCFALYTLKPQPTPATSPSKSTALLLAISRKASSRMATRAFLKYLNGHTDLRKLKLVVYGGIGVYVWSNTFYSVQGGHRAILFNRLSGVKDKVYGEGMHIRWPFLEKPIHYEIRAQPHLIESISGTRDLQTVKVVIRILSRPIAPNLPEIYRTVGHDYDERVMPSVVQEAIKTVIARYNASELVTQRNKVSEEIWDVLKKRAMMFKITLDDVSLIHVSFGKEFTTAVEAKQVAAQEAERVKFVVEKAEQEKKSVIIRAEGEAKSAELIGTAMESNPSFITLRQIEAAREIAHTVAEGENKVYRCSSDLLLNLRKH